MVTFSITGVYFPGAQKAPFGCLSSAISLGNMVWPQIIGRCHFCHCKLEPLKYFLFWSIAILTFKRFNARLIQCDLMPAPTFMSYRNNGCGIIKNQAGKHSLVSSFKISFAYFYCSAAHVCTIWLGLLRRKVRKGRRIREIVTWGNHTRVCRLTVTCCRSVDACVGI